MNKLGISMDFKIFLFCFIPFLSSCTYLNPYIADLNLISLPQERQMGEQVGQEIKSQMKMVETPSVVQSVHEIGVRLTLALPRRDFDYQFYVVEDPTPNAFTIPGGKIYVHTGLLKLTSGDMHELAGVMAHELAHAYARHPTQSITRQYGASFISGLLLKNNPTAMKKILVQMTAGSIVNRYGRAEEFEADDLGYTLMQKAGYDPSGLIRFFKKLEAQEPMGSNLLAFLNTHPSTSERIARLQARQTGLSTIPR